MEFRIWAELIEQSRGGLHVFLPLLDRGLDGIIHRLTDGRYIAVQVKSRSVLHGHSMELVIPANKLVDDGALIIAGLLDGTNLGPQLLVVEEGTYKRLASTVLFQGEEMFWVQVDLSAPIERWQPYVVPRDSLAERLLGEQPSLGVTALEPLPIDRYNKWLGFLGESETIRQLAQNPRLDLFRPFPDVEMVEVLARDDVTRRFCGIQVKTATVDKTEGHAVMHIRKATFVPSPTTFVAGLAWLGEPSRFSDECLLVPTERLPQVATDSGDRWELKFHPHSPKSSRLDDYRLPLAELGTRVGAETAAHGA